MSSLIFLHWRHINLLTVIATANYLGFTHTGCWASWPNWPNCPLPSPSSHPPALCAPANPSSQHTCIPPHTLPPNRTQPDTPISLTSTPEKAVLKRRLLPANMESTRHPALHDVVACSSNPRAPWVGHWRASSQHRMAPGRSAMLAFRTKNAMVCWASPCNHAAKLTPRTMA